MKYADLRDKYSFEEVSDLFLKNGFDKGQIMQNEYAYKQSHGMAPEKKTSSFQDWMLKNENVNITEIGNSILKSAEGYARAGQEGFNESNIGIMTRGKLPEESSTDFTTGQRMFKGTVGVLSDSPIYFAGGAAGVALENPVLASTGAFALEDAVRSVLMKAYKDGEINSFGEFVDRLDEFDWGDVWDVTKDTTKGALTGAAVGKAGVVNKAFSKQLSKKLHLDGMKAKTLETGVQLAGDTTAFVGANSLLNLEVPTKDDFIDAAGVLLGLKGVHYVQNKYMPKLKKKTDKPANDDVMADIEKTLGEIKVTYNPNWQQQVVKDSGSRITYTVDNQEISQLQGDIAGWLMDYYAKTGIGPREAVIEVKKNPAKIAEIAGYNQDQQAVINARVKEKLPWFGETDKLTEEQIAEIEKATQEVREEMGLPNSENYVIWNNKKLPVEYEVVEADTIKSSHDAEGNRNKDFPEYMQNRERDRKASQEQINNMAANFQPEFVTRSYDPQNGAPIITKDGYVIAGNGRFAATRLAQEKGTDGYYRDIATQINPAAKDMKNPIIVRRLTNEYSEDEIRDMVQKSNQSTTLRLSKSEAAKDDAARIDDDLLNMMDTETELSSAENKKFIDSALNKVIPENEKGAMLDKNGKVTNEGINRINNALLANVIRDDNMLSKLIETEDPVLKKVGNGLTKSAPAIVRMEKDIADGKIKESYSITEDLNEALNLYDKFKKSGMSLDDFLSQGDMFNKSSPAAESLLKIFQSSRGGNVIKDILKDYTNTATEISGGFNFDIPEMTKSDILNEAYKKRSKGLPAPQTLGQNYEDYRTVSNPDLTSNMRNGEKSPSAENNITPKDENVKYNELNDEVQDLAYEGETPKNGLVKSDIYLGDKSMINVAYSGDIKAKPISKTDIADNFKKRFDVAYKKGKMYKKGSVRGFYKPHQEVIRTRGYDDFPVLVHETAHHLDKILFKGNQTLTKDERKIYAKELEGIASVGDPFEEGFAEFVSYYVTNPEYVKKYAPKFYKHFQEFMKENEPAILEVLDGAQKDWQAWREQPSDARVRGQVSYRMKDAGVSFTKMAHDFYTNYVDDLHPLKVLEDDALKSARKRNINVPIELKPSKSPYILARLYRGEANKVANYLDNKAFNTRLEEVGESYKDIFGDLKADELEELNMYLIAKRSIDLNMRGIETGIGRKDAETIVKNLEGKWGERAYRVYRYINNLMQYAIDAGLISEEQFAAMRKADPHYVPFEREYPVDDRPMARRLAPSQVVKRMKGSDRRIVPVHESLLKNTANIIANADKNIIMQRIAELAELEGSGKYIERVPSKKKVALPKGTHLMKENEDNIIHANTVELVDPQTGNTITFAEMTDEFWTRKGADNKTEITVFRDGEPKVYEVTPEFANLVNGLSPQDVNVLWKTARLPATTLRAGATLTPEFAIKNAIRDNLEAFINSEGLFIPFVDQAKGGYHLLRSDKELKDWQNAGGSLANFIPKDRKAIQKRIKKINKNYDLIKSTGYTDAVINQVKDVNPIGIARLASEASEDSTRLGAYGVNKKHFKKKGYSEYDAKLGAAFASREATLDFARIGAKVRGLNSIIAFLNAGIQGTDKMARNLKNHPVKTLGALSVIMLPSLLFHFANEGDEDIKDLNKTVKDTNWVTKVNGKMVKIPKPQNAIPFLTMLERTLDSTPDEWWTNVKGGLADYLELNVWSNMPTALQPIIEKERNKTSYLGLKLVPAEVENLMPEYQFTGATSETAKWVSKTLSNFGISNSYTSPIVLDQFVRDWTGGTGQYILNGLDYVSTGKEKEDIYDYEHTPLFKAFRVAYPTRGNSQAYKDFMEKSEKLIKQYDTGKYLLKHDPQDMTYAAAQKYGYIKKYRATIVDLGRTLKAIQDNKKMSVQEKRENADMLNSRMIDLSKQGLTLIDTISE